MFKYFDWLPRKDQEERALRAFAPTELVPKLHAVESDSILVMERLRGSTLHVAEQDLTRELQEQVYHQLGQAMARIVEAAPGVSPRRSSVGPAKMGLDYPFYCQADLSDLMDTVVERSAKVLREQDVPHEAILHESLSALRRQRDAILAYPSFIQMDDFHAGNIVSDGAELVGFIDLEMTRSGNEVLLLAAALAMTMYERPERWTWIRRGYEEVRRESISDELLSLACVAAPFSQWIRFMWYWTGDPGQWEEGARGWPIRDVKAVVEGLRKAKL